MTLHPILTQVLGDLPDLASHTELSTLFVRYDAAAGVRQLIEERYGDTTQQAFERCQTVADLEALVAGLCAEAVL